MGATTIDDVKGLFKVKYKSLESVLPDSSFPAQELMQGSEGVKDGDSIQVSVQLTHENGVSFAGVDSVIDFNDAQSQVIKPANIKSSEMWLGSQVQTQVLAKAAKQGEQAFESASSRIISANLKSHMRFRELAMLYGQDEYGIGRVNFRTSTFRNVAFTDGAGTLGGVTLATGGVDTVNKYLMFDPNDLTLGILAGSKGMEIEEVTAAGAVVASGKIVAVDCRNGIVKVDFVPVAASSIGSHHIKLKGQRAGLDMIGAKKILTNTGTLFGIDAAEYDMWRGSNTTITGKLTFDKLMDSLVEIVDMGLDGDVEVQVPFETWNTLFKEQAALRKYDASYTPQKMENGASKIQFHFQNCLISIVSNRFIRRSEAFIFEKGAWNLYGAKTEIGLKVPGSDGDDLIVKPISGNYYMFHSYSCSQVFCHCPRRSMILLGINPESET